MKAPGYRRLLASLALAFCVGSIAYRSNAWRRILDAPYVTCDAPRFDFGRRRPNVVVQHTFRLVNQGGRALSIRKVTSDCRCLTSEVKDASIGPGQSLALPVAIDLRGHPQGAVDAKILVETADVRRKYVVLRVAGVVDDG